MKSSTMQYQKYLSYLIFIISLNSCTTWHYTNYGKPFDFLKAQRVSCKSQETSSNDLVQPFPSMAKMESKKSNSNKDDIKTWVATEVNKLDWDKDLDKSKDRKKIRDQITKKGKKTFK